MLLAWVEMHLTEISPELLTCDLCDSGCPMRRNGVRLWPVIQICVPLHAPHSILRRWLAHALQHIQLKIVGVMLEQNFFARTLQCMMLLEVLRPLRCAFRASHMFPPFV